MPNILPSIGISETRILHRAGYNRIIGDGISGTINDEIRRRRTINSHVGVNRLFRTTVKFAPIGLKYA